MCVEVRSQNREKVQLKYLLWVGVPASPTVNMSELSLVSVSLVMSLPSSETNTALGIAPITLHKHLQVFLLGKGPLGGSCGSASHAGTTSAARAGEAPSTLEVDRPGSEPQAWRPWAKLLNLSETQ